MTKKEKIKKKDWANAECGDHESLTGGWGSVLRGGFGCKLSGGKWSHLTANNHSDITAGDYSYITLGTFCTACSGDRSVVRAFAGCTLTVGNESTIILFDEDEYGCTATITVTEGVATVICYSFAGVHTFTLNQGKYECTIRLGLTQIKEV